MEPLSFQCGESMEGVGIEIFADMSILKPAGRRFNTPHLNSNLRKKIVPSKIFPGADCDIFNFSTAPLPS